MSGSVNWLGIVSAVIAGIVVLCLIGWVAAFPIAILIVFFNFLKYLWRVRVHFRWTWRNNEQTRGEGPIDHYTTRAGASRSLHYEPH